MLTKKDKADIKETKQWLAYFQKHHMKAIALDARDSKNDKIILKEAQDLMKEKREKPEKSKIFRKRAESPAGKCQRGD